MAALPPGVTVTVHWPKYHARRAWERHQAWLRQVHDMPNSEWQAGQKWFKARKDAALKAARVLSPPEDYDCFTIKFKSEEK